MPGEVVSGIQASKSIKFQKGAALLCVCIAGRLFDVQENEYERKRKLLRHDPAASPVGISGILHEKRSCEDRKPDCRADRRGYGDFSLKSLNILLAL